MTELNAAFCLDTKTNKFKFSFPRVGFESTTSRIYSHTVPLRHNRPHFIIFISLINLIFFIILRLLVSDIIFSFKLSPTHDQVGRGNLVLRHSISHSLPNFKDIAY